MSTRRRGRRFRQLRSYARICNTRLRRQKLICLHLMMSSCKPQLDWLSSRIISWQRNWSINQNRLSNCFPKTTKWSLKLRSSKKISRFTKRLKKSWPRGLIPAKKLSKSLRSKWRSSNLRGKNLWARRMESKAWELSTLKFWTRAEVSVKTEPMMMKLSIS